ncbi:MAG: hypothetical protein P1V36_05285 [Planctomycetota bacterium]|nr:hypothetical protein [Planctomycetota bacterium]
MSKPGLLIALLAALGVGWLIGSMTGAGGGSDMTHDEVAGLQEEVARLRLALGERGPSLRASTGPAIKGRETAAEPGEMLPPPPATYAKTDAFDITKHVDADIAFQALLAYAATMLDKGVDGHLALLHTLDRTLFDKPGEKIVDELVGGEDQMMRYTYPVLRFAMNREDQVADLTETLFKTMAEDPEQLKELDGDLFELFTESIAPMLPGMVGPKRMDRFRGYARAILDSDPATQPGVVQRQRRDIQKAMESWAPRMTKEEAFQRLQQGDVSPEEATALLRRLDPLDVARLDVDGVLGPLLEKDPWTVISVLGRAKLDASTIEALDTRVIQGAVGVKLKQSVVHYWLRYTGRGSFDRARPFLERGLQQSSKQSSGTFLLTALACKPGPDESWVQWAEERFELSEEVRVALIRMREQKK